MIELKGLEKTYHTGGVDTPVLHGIDLTPFLCFLAVSCG